MQNQSKSGEVKVYLQGDQQAIQQVAQQLSNQLKQQGHEVQLGSGFNFSQTQQAQQKPLTIQIEQIESGQQGEQRSFGETERQQQR